MHHVIFINGKPRSGKDSFVEFVADRIRKHGGSCRNLSSITPVIHRLKRMGFEAPADKNDDWRNFLSGMGDLLEIYASIRTDYCVNNTLSHHYASGNRVTFIHTREPKMIDKMKARLAVAAQRQKMQIRVVTLFIDRPDIVVAAQNHADQNVANYNYDHYVLNDKDLVWLHNRAIQFTDKIMKGDI